MYITDEILREVERKYGVPKVIKLKFEMDKDEFNLMRESMHHNRAHDVTFIIEKGDKIAVIRKPMHPPGVYRIPSGGVEPGEEIEAGIIREAYEETGLRIEIVRYLLRVEACFTSNDDHQRWISHVFQTRWVSGELDPKDRREIEDARWVTLDELCGEIRERMLESSSGGLHYRVALTDAAIKELLSPDSSSSHDQ
ncbi:MAG TPA: NUDIX hydrolase [Candidatus Syntrophoarchaeum butanivorans]|uniref:NUDIX hydrolase n=1 Tax=Candidatus Syntropharchaeum butanivorans TaxID=1839936 RepID=A0A7J2S484_9EURY|nr:MAG: NUDIX hydrolase [Candidatus Syntrophoarchaeum sp. WYZ-LMO15]HEC57380.1 NUDIX hydrolase [Candidatus Syntrophoarchaeum butanivorans]